MPQPIEVQREQIGMTADTNIMFALLGFDEYVLSHLDQAAEAVILSLTALGSTKSCSLALDELKKMRLTPWPGGQ